MQNAKRALQAVAFTIAMTLAAPAGAEIIDRVLAVVDTRIITLSDARAALAFGYVIPAPNADRTHAAMTYLIDRELMLIEVERYLPAEPSDERIEERLAVLRSRFPTPAAFDTLLATTGLSLAQVRELARDDLRIDSYIEDRFSSAVQPTDEEVAAYARAHRAEIEPLAASASAQLAIARSRLAAERRQARTADWVGGLRRRADITELYLPAR